MTVLATREGLVGQRTSSGYVIDPVVSFVALPSVKALHAHVKVTNVINMKTAIAEVLDVGPHNSRDDAYVFGGARPLAESGTSDAGPNTARNKAGIDLGQRVWNELGMLDNGDVMWEFLT